MENTENHTSEKKTCCAVAGMEKLKGELEKIIQSPESKKTLLWAVVGSLVAGCLLWGFSSMSKKDERKGRIEELKIGKLKINHLKVRKLEVEEQV